MEGKTCDLIDDHAIELYVMGKLEDAAAISHLDICPNCKARIEDFREYVEAMKQGLKAWMNGRG